MREIIKKRINESIDVKKKLLENEELISNLETLVSVITEAIRDDHKIVICGNGGSASDALHFAGEIIGRFEKERDAWPVVVLNADVTTMTAISNDYGYANVYARQAQGHCKAGDVFIGISTSGNSENVLRAIEVAKSKGAKVAALLGKDGGEIGKLVDYPLIVSSMITARIQEAHILLIHIMCEMIEKDLY